MTRWTRIAATCLLLAALLAVGGCRLGEEEPQAAEKAETTPVSTVIEAPTLEEFIAAQTKSADFTLVTTQPDGTISADQTGTLWLAPDRFRYDLYEGDTLIRSILTPDGENAYFAQHEEQVCEPSVAPVSNYMAKFNPPPSEAVEDGTDEETGALRMRYELKETYSIPGAANSWYQEDIVFLIKDGEVIGIVTRGGVPEDDGTVEALQTERRMLTNLKAGVDIPDDTFELPYPVSE